jgi:tyrosine-specific transport protein
MSSTVSSVKEGSVFGGILLIAGSCIGAGMLALPVITGIAGFFPSVTMFLFAWLFMMTTSLLLLEVNLTLGYNLSLVSLAEKTLGSSGKFLTWVLFVFLFYSLSIAYIAASGSILQSILKDLFNYELSQLTGSILFTLVFGIVIYIGTRSVDYLNRFLMIGLIVAYCILVLLGVFHIHSSYLMTQAWKYAFAAIPVIIISFGYHNMIPSLAYYFKGDLRRLRISIFLGSLVPLFIYLLWEAVMLGIIPIHGREGLLHTLDQGKAATHALRAAVGKSWINTVAQAFALLAIVTSFLAQSLSLVDFLADGLKIKKQRGGRLLLILLTLAPPFIFAFLFPGIFIKALNIAGGFSAVILFGVMPAAMVWVLRYRKGGSVAPVLPTGRYLLAAVLLVAFGIFFLELAQEMGFSLIPDSTEIIP